MTHVIGPKTKHAYEKGAKAIVVKKMGELAARGRAKRADTLRFSTYTLRYNTMDWVTIDGLLEHWKPASIRVQIYSFEKSATIDVDRLKNVSAFSIHMPAGSCPIATGGGGYLSIEGVNEEDQLEVPGPQSDRSYDLSVYREGPRGKWKFGPPLPRSPQEARPPGPHR